jgi:hypothetical protein
MVMWPSWKNMRKNHGAESLAIAARRKRNLVAILTLAVRMMEQTPKKNNVQVDDVTVTGNPHLSS